MGAFDEATSLKIIDISRPIDSRLPVWPGDPPIEISRFLDIEAGDTVNASRLSFSAHIGTHVDAPLHHFGNGIGIDQLNLADLIGPAVVADIPHVAAIDTKSLDRLRLAPGVRRLLLKTDNCRIWSEGCCGFQRDFVALTPDAAEWIVARGIRLVGIDYMSVEPFGAAVPEVHRTLLGAGVIVLEGLDLRDVRPATYQLICLPLRVSNVDGAPARAVLVEADGDAAE